MVARFSGVIPSGSPAIPGTPSTIPGTPSSVPAAGDIRAPSSLRLRDMKGRFVTGGFGWEWTNLQELMNQPEKFGGELLAEVQKGLEELATAIQTYAQENAPWIDQTGDARRGLKSLFIQRRDVFEIDLGHSVSYGFYLENANGGEYAIIQPTLRVFAPQMRSIVQQGGDHSAEPLSGGFE